MKALIVDDEASGAENLRNLLLRYCPQVTIVGEASNNEEAEKLITEHSPDLVFLDVMMPRGNGFDLLERYKRVPFEVIFVTAFEKYALKAIQLSACDYLLKPIDITLLKESVRKAMERIATKAENHSLKTLMLNLRSMDRERRIALPSMHGMVFVKVTDIIHCKADNSYTWFHFVQGEPLLSTKNLGEYENLLEECGFMRVHHANIVNKQHVVEFKKGNSPVLILTSGATVSVAQRRKDSVVEWLTGFS